MSKLIGLEFPSVQELKALAAGELNSLKRRMAYDRCLVLIGLIAQKCPHSNCLNDEFIRMGEHLYILELNTTRRCISYTDYRNSGRIHENTNFLALRSS